MRFVILGTGYIGPVNTKALMACEGAEIVGVANRTAAKAEAMCRELGLSCPVFTDWKEALEKTGPDAAVICVFNDQHKEYFLECARRHIHVLMEKPFANTYEDCVEMMEAARANGIRVSVLQTQRYGAVLSTVKKYQREHREELGRLCHVTDEISCNYFWEGRNPWHLDDVRSGGGIVLNYGVHQLDRVRFLMEQPTAAFHAHYLKEKEGIGTCSSYTMMGTAVDGASYVITCAGYSGPSVNEIKLYYQKKTILARLAGSGAGDRGVFAGDTASGIFEPVPLCCEDGDGGHEMYVREMRAAAEYLEGRCEEPPVSMEWGAEMVRLCCLGFEEGRKN